MEGEWSACELDCSREKFVGRGRTLAAPLALSRAGALPGTTGAVLDPVAMTGQSS